MQQEKNKRLFVWCLVFGVWSLVLSGCETTRTRSVIKQRVDQDLSSGNRGYVYGSIPPQEMKERKNTRKTYEVEIELKEPFKFKRRPAAAEIEEKTVSLDERWTEERQAQRVILEEEKSDLSDEATSDLEVYTVKPGDTLQKISAEFYGTTRKWQKIYKANKDVLKSPDRVYPGKKLKIPQD